MAERREWSTASVSARPHLEIGDTSAGLVLVYSREFKDLPSAVTCSTDRITMGREPDNTWPLPDGSVSRYHAKVTRFSTPESDTPKFVLTDLGSTNGTIVNGAYVNEVVLQQGDLIRVGDTLLKFVARDCTAFGAYRIDGAVDVDRRPVPRTTGPSALVGGHQMDRVISALEKVAESDLSVVVRGESGTGKELAAREIHRLSGRPGPLQAINCGALPETLIESELFGHRRGSFSGAVSDKVGLVKAADGGTLFLDEIGEMPLEAQVKLLRVLQEREVLPIGGTQSERVDVRVVAATNRDLAGQVQLGRFRGDLFARLNEFSIELPPLRERKEDLYLLACHFFEKHGRSGGKPSLPLMLGLSHYDWPYNVRELESALRRAAALAGPGEIDVAHLPDPVHQCLRNYASRQDRSLQTPVPDQTRVASAPMPAAVRKPPSPSAEELRAALARHAGNVSALARLYGKDRVQIHRWLRRYGIDPEQYRSEFDRGDGDE